ncbi:MAG: glycosyltransferase [Cyanobacteria bacterium RI_101]|nr:glycosyltransferase [Cyanobacteria bacterium RI_101]
MVQPNRQAIALISDHADPAGEIGMEEAGGQNVYVRRIGESLAELGWQVDIFTRRSAPDDPAIVEHAPHCRTIRLKAGPEAFVPRNELFAYMPEFLAAFQKFQTKQAIRYPLIHSNYWLSGWVGLQLKQEQNSQLIHTYHSLGAVKYDALQSRPAIAPTRLGIETELLERSDCVVATSPQEKEVLNRYYADQGRVEVIPCGTTPNFHNIPKAQARQNLGWGREKKIVLYVGRFDPRKGIETLVRACAQLKNQGYQHLQLVLAGGSSLESLDGAERRRIEALVRELDLSAETLFAGRIPHDSLPWHYSAADVCVIPSYYEPFGLVSIEAIACGTPVIASRVGGLKFSVIPEETGLLVQPRNVEELAQAIERVLEDELWAKKLKKQANSDSNPRFSWKSSAMQLSNLYRYSLARSIMHDQPWNPEVSRLTALDAPAPADLVV